MAAQCRREPGPSCGFIRLGECGDRRRGRSCQGQLRGSGALLPSSHFVRHSGGERILDVFEIKLKEAIQKLPFQKILTLKNVQNVVNEADG